MLAAGIDVELTTLSVAREEANEKYMEYVEALRKRDAAYLHDLKRLYGAMRKGRIVLDIWQSFRETGLDANGDPKIAVGRADWTEIDLKKFGEGSSWWRDIRFQAIFSDRNRTPHPVWRTGEMTDINQRDDVTVPKETWAFPLENNRVPTRQHLRTRVPIVPAQFLPNGDLSNYHILWEVERWDVVTPPKDPLLLKRISPNMFVVLAVWELTELERAVLRGRIG